MKSTKEAEAISAILARLERAKNVLIANMTNFCNLKLDVDFFMPFEHPLQRLSLSFS